MPRNAFKFDPYYDDIVQGRQLGQSIQAILDSLAASYPDFQTSKSALQRQIEAWDIPKWSILKDTKVLDFVRNEWVENSYHQEILTQLN
jgi:hypothetical protein